MPNITDSELILRLVQSTIERRLAWEKIEDVADRFAAKYAGKWTLTIDKSVETNERYPHYWLALSNAEGEEIMKIYSDNVGGVDELFELARRQALKVDEALSDLLKEIDEPQS
jgi:hypothetical protein